MNSTCSSCPVADAICRMIEVVLTIAGALDGEGDAITIQARPLEVLPFCPTCGAEGVLRDHVVGELTDLPVAGRPCRLQVRLPRYQCAGERCPQQTSKTTNRCTRGSCRNSSLRR